MKKSLSILAVSLLAIGSLFAAKTNDLSVNWGQEEAVIQQDVDFSSLSFEKVDVTALPDAVKEVLKGLEGAGAKLEEAAAAKTPKGTAVFRLILAGAEKKTTVYLDEEGKALQNEAPKSEKVE